MTTKLPQIPTLYNKIAARIIKQQEELIGSIAWTLARKVTGITIAKTNTPEDVVIADTPKEVINSLVAVCEFIWGRLGKMQCIEATADITRSMRTEDIPDSLK